ncbi:MAG: hypothetical protein EAZ42_00700 [Verrucomicrobia bacterium]|nr:MAG: hypothetical protein EAZ42_00700 [Verrucomicrobiota bacterium]
MIAREILRRPNLQISVLVLNEFISSARNPKKFGLSREAKSDWLLGWLAMTVATALSLHSPVLYTEDIEHGQIIEGLEIINPFLEE